MKSKKKLAEQSRKELQKQGPFKGRIVTPIKAFKNFYRAEDYHQDYYKKSKLKYTFYRYSSGRDQFLKKTWRDFKDFRSFPLLKGEREKNKKTNADSEEIMGNSSTNKSSEHKTDNFKSDSKIGKKPLL